MSQPKETAWRVTDMQMQIEPMKVEAGRDVTGLGSSHLSVQLMSEGRVYIVRVSADHIMTSTDIVNAFQAAASSVSVTLGGQPVAGARIAGLGEAKEILNG